MAEFNWMATPDRGVCNSCGTSSNDRGFVDMIGDNVVIADTEIVGVVDAIYCGACIEQAARLFGSTTKSETEEFAYREAEKEEEIRKLKDEITSWQQRFLGMAKLDIEDFEKLAKLERGTEIDLPPGA